VQVRAISDLRAVAVIDGLGGLLADAEAAVREYAVYLSHDTDTARRRDDGDLADQLAQRRRGAVDLAEQLHATSPATVAGAPLELHEVRALAAMLVYRLGALQPETRRAAARLSHPLGMIGVMPSKTRTAVAYLRVSTDRQAEEGFGLEVQEAAVRLWARKNGVRLVDVVRDEGRSGAADVIDRPGLAAALGEVMAGRAGAIVVPRLDRLARALELQEWVRADLIKLGAQLRSADPVEDMYLVADPDNPTGTLVRQILGAVAQYERAMISLRMKAGKAQKGERGGYIGGGPPYGYKADGGQLVPNIEEQRVVSRMRRWRRDGKSLRYIAERLNSEGVAARKGRWHPQTVARVLERAGVRKAS
jgi:DNA invertase Pin-like site-specific DNA recombinase